MYRDYVAPLVVPDTGIKMIRAGLSSMKLFKEQDDSIKELFETDDQLVDFIENEHVFEFYKEDEFVGCGMIVKTHPDYHFCDLGVWVNPLKRGKSTGAQILLNLRNFATHHNMKPCCGCAIQNIPSQKVIEKCGFVSKYKILRFNTVR